MLASEHLLLSIWHCCSSCQGKHNKLSQGCPSHPTARRSYRLVFSNLVMRHSFLLPAHFFPQMFSKSISLFSELARNKTLKSNAERNLPTLTVRHKEETTGCSEMVALVVLWCYVPHILPCARAQGHRIVAAPFFKHTGQEDVVLTFLMEISGI